MELNATSSSSWAAAAGAGAAELGYCEELRRQRAADSNPQSDSGEFSPRATIATPVPANLPVIANTMMVYWESL